MRQIISACRLCEELELVKEFVPRGIWRMVRGTDRMAGRGHSQGLGSLEVLETMAKRCSVGGRQIGGGVGHLISGILFAEIRGSIGSRDRLGPRGCVCFTTSKQRIAGSKGRRDLMCAGSSASSGCRWRNKVAVCNYLCSKEGQRNSQRRSPGYSERRNSGTLGGTVGDV